MVRNFLQKGKAILYGRQASIVSAATVIMIMIAASRLLGLVRNRVFVHFFAPEQLDTYLAAFQLPDLIFEVLVLGAMSSAFIPVFTRSLAQNKGKEGWYLAGLTMNILFLFFLGLSSLIFIFAHPLYRAIAQGFTPSQIEQTVFFTRILLIAQMFFTLSYVFTAALESNQRFLAPAVAPLFYNIGIIVSTIFFAPRFGLIASVWGAVAGSFLHVLVQAPLAVSLGFRPVFSLDFRNPALRKIGKLAAPRILELSSFQIKRLVDLFLASLVVGGLTYFKFADSVAVLPISLFGLSIAKASLPQLSLKAEQSTFEDFKNTFASSFRQILFFVLPASIFLSVLRTPIVRLVFGGAQFDWQDTVQTGYVLSGFALGIFAYALSLLVSRAFYALHDTVTPVKVSFITISINIGLGFLFVLGLGLPIWSLALSYSLAGIVQFVILFVLLSKRIGSFSEQGLVSTFFKVVASAFTAGTLMFFLLKVMDRAAWDKKLSFLGQLGLAPPTTFDKFVLDTRYTVNLVILTFLVGLVGLGIYVAVAHVLGVRELGPVLKVVRRVSFRRPLFVRPEEKTEAVVPSHVNGE
ncbi:MAG: murein biosynthesis integral membrane protein MurJ [Candidatus Blackburnbacteria bacterium]|nr:murein biosynthesis integral membrane protein MurJ [Candidatus Blackburnbacteria bacterium]